VSDVRGGAVWVGAVGGLSTGAGLSVVCRVEVGVVAGLAAGVAVISGFGVVATAIGRRRTDADAAESVVSSSSSAFEERARASVVPVAIAIVAGIVARGVRDARRVHRAVVASGGVGLVARVITHPGMGRRDLPQGVHAKLGRGAHLDVTRA
jgi:hypothetical protein